MPVPERCQYILLFCVSTGEASGSKWEGVFRLANGAEAASSCARFCVRLHRWISHQVEIQVVAGGSHDQGTTTLLVLYRIHLALH